MCVCVYVYGYIHQTLEKGKLFKHHSKWIEHKLCCLNGMNVNNFLQRCFFNTKICLIVKTRTFHIKYRQNQMSVGMVKLGTES